MISPLTGLSFSSPPQVDRLQPVLHWFKERPKLDDPEANYSLSFNIPQEVEVQPLQSCREKAVAAFVEAGKAIRAGYDRVATTALPHLATPAIVLGLILTLVGVGGTLTALTGWRIPGLEIILKNIPLSLMFSLTSILAGLHAIKQGVKLSRDFNRNRQEVKIKNHIFHIQNKVEPLSTEEAQAKFAEIKRLNAALPPSLRLDRTLQSHEVYGKAVSDVPTGRLARCAYKLETEKLLREQGLIGAVPELEIPQVATITERAAVDEIDVDMKDIERNPTLSERWYNFWYARLPFIGACDMALGQVMLFTAIAGLTILLVPGSNMPAGLAVIAQDPYLSISFAFLFLSHWVSCTQSGWRMLTYSKREQKRDRIEDELQRIDVGLEKDRATEFHNWLTGRLTQNGVEGDVLAKLQENFDLYLEKLPQNAPQPLQGVAPLSPFYQNLHLLGKEKIPKLATPTILIGIIIALLGITYLGTSLTGHLPSQLQFLATNKPVTVLFSTGLILSGIHAIHRGATLSEKAKKSGWKKSGEEIREEFLTALPHLSKPNRVPKKGAEKTISGHIVVDVVPNQQRMRAMPKIKEFGIKQTEKSAFHSFWVGSLNYLWVPDAILGAFLLACSTAGLAMCMGAPISASFHFVISDPSFSIAFCVSLLGVALDALNTSWRIYSYKTRKEDDRKDLEALESSYHKLLAHKG